MTVNIDFDDFSHSANFSPPTVWNMGEYHGLILSYDDGANDFVVESTGAYGAPPSSGRADTSANTIDLNLSDLHMTTSIWVGYGYATGDFDLWNAVTSTIDANTYDSITGAISYAWSDTATLEFGLLDYTVGYSIELVGTASTVPEPASLLLLGSGLVGLVGLKRKCRKT